MDIAHLFCCRLVQSQFSSVKHSSAEAVYLHLLWCHGDVTTRLAYESAGGLQKWSLVYYPKCSCLQSACSFADGESLSGSLLLGELHLGLLSLLNAGALLSGMELNVAVGGEVGSDATVCTVGSPAALDGALAHNVRDDDLVEVEALGLTVGSQVDEELADSLDGLLGPPTSGHLPLLALGVSANTAEMLSERNDLLVLEHILHVLDSDLDLHALHSASSFVRIFVVSSQVVHLALSGYRHQQDTGLVTD